MKHNKREKPKEKQQRKQEEKRFPGGLLIVNPLPRHYPTPQIYDSMIRAKFRLDHMHGLTKDAQQMLWDLQTRPTNVTEFVNKFDHYNQLSWAYANLVAEENACHDCQFSDLFYSKEPFLQKVRVDRKFIECSDMMESAKLEIHPDSMDEEDDNFFGDEWDYQLTKRVHKVFTGTVKHIDAYNQELEVDITSGENPASGEYYKIIILPNSMVFYSRCRTLDWIHNHCGWGEFIFPEQRDALIRNLISEPEYDKMEAEFLAKTVFSSRRNFNQNQKRAIHAIVSGYHGPVPYILFGPPGTGKTVTLVEAIRLLLSEQTQKERRVLVCTSSNTAADNFVYELLDTFAFHPTDLLRIFSFSKKVKDQSQRLRDAGVLCINTEENENFERFGIPPIEELLQKRVIVCTLNTSTYLIDGGLENCFTHIVIDEAGQADELETLVPIVGLTDPHSQSALHLRRGPSTRAFKGTHVVLAGDPQQLGPVQTCDTLKRVSKPGSLIERLIGHERDRNFFHFDKRVTTMLEENYRSHPALITIPSRLYYGGKLRSSAPIKEKNTLCQWSNLPKKDFPLLWHSVEEVEQTDDNGFSYENRAEVEIVHQYVKALIKRAGVRPGEIGIIAPYRHQVRQLIQRCADYPSILIDSVERFQGSERRVIIISTVRSTGIGFLDCDKRFNTAITRPKELLIIVGSSFNMRRVPAWEELVNYCEQNGALIGQTELRVVQKQKAAPEPIFLSSFSGGKNQKGGGGHRMHRSMGGDKVEELAREFGGMDMEDWLRKQQPQAKNTGLFYRADEEAEEQEFMGEMHRKWGQPSSSMDFYNSRQSYASSFADALSACSNSFHMSASQCGANFLNESTASSSIAPSPAMPPKVRKPIRFIKPMAAANKLPDSTPSSLHSGSVNFGGEENENNKNEGANFDGIVAYTLEDASNAHEEIQKKLQLLNMDLPKTLKQQAMEESSTSPDEDEFESTSSRGISPHCEEEDEDALEALKREMDALEAMKREMDEKLGGK